jgi:hypothetical protein
MGFHLQSIASPSTRRYVEALVRSCERRGGWATMESLGMENKPTDFGLPGETRLREM